MINVERQKSGNCVGFRSVFVPSQVRIPGSVAPHFALFESLDPRFDRKLGPDEVPHAIYVANYSTAAPTCILLKKWVFSLKLEAALMSSGKSGKK